MNIHPKVGGAALGGTVGVLITAILHSTGWHVDPELPGAIAAFCAAVGGWLAPAADSLQPPTAAAQAPAREPTAADSPGGVL